MDGVIQSLRERLPRQPEGDERISRAKARAAVFALFVERPATHLVFIQRADRGDPWSNQIAFPGGRIEAVDADTLAAAYRETHEEIGVSADDIELLGDIGVMRTLTSEMRVHAFVGRWNMREPVTPNPAEVAEVIEAPVRDLLNTHRAHGYAGVSTNDLGMTLTYALAGRTVWGLTARIVHGLLELLPADAAQTA